MKQTENCYGGDTLPKIYCYGEDTLPKMYFTFYSSTFSEQIERDIHKQ